MSNMRNNVCYFSFGLATLIFYFLWGAYAAYPKLFAKIDRLSLEPWSTKVSEAISYREKRNKLTAQGNFVEAWEFGDVRILIAFLISARQKFGSIL